MAGEVPRNQDCTFVAPLAQPTRGAGGVSSLIFSTHIAASPEKCLEIVLDSSAYPTWNKLVRQATVEKQSPATATDLGDSLGFLLASGKQDMLLPGADFVFNAYLDPDSDSFRSTRLEVTVLKEIVHEGRKGFRVSWAMTEGTWLQHVERTQDFVEAPGGGTDYYNMETFYGPVSYLIKPIVGTKLLKALGLWKDGLKAEAERQCKEETTKVSK
ncbi:uncharacterized protein B0I36DRAFT_435293 [Microdochium trichocladiopsis]|uniref:Coenzyme Q-binding protein COQ10 START domain-containing protein n=1 Tax=Microdochium trichocladiopsis TaxID=1682393 RepID=A0A9P8XX10_9PEZI|nr:uncharacterized protein B0I36DRAFT_435293 [Microdochium trichocladiopsis]KAH7021502.1 hypothetical protein B0I36DRAFT_435293 [Microdochium trichocladiopsis]